MTITVIDNFLEKNVFEEIKDNISGPFFPWYKNDNIVGEHFSLDKNEKYNLQFIHTFYKNYSPKSDFINLISPIIDKINPLSIIRIKANLTIGRHSFIEHGYHVDSENLKVTAGILYINSNNGKTKFNNKEEINSVENRFVEFDANMPHSGVCCTDEKYRCLINLNYIKNNNLEGVR